jgi:hypothetical protein
VLHVLCTWLQSTGESSPVGDEAELTRGRHASHHCIAQANYKDLDDKRVVTDYEIKEYARECGSHVVAAEASMLNRFGVKAIKTFFNLPFLQMERNVLEQQLRRNEEEIALAEQEVAVMSEEQNYA